MTILLKNLMKERRTRNYGIDFDVLFVLMRSISMVCFFIIFDLKLGWVIILAALR